jgi:hypothetical protein
MMGNRYGFGKGLGVVKALTAEQGAATSIYASFEPTLKGLLTCASTSWIRLT